MTWNVGCAAIAAAVLFALGTGGALAQGPGSGDAPGNDANAEVGLAFVNPVSRTDLPRSGSRTRLAAKVSKKKSGTKAVKTPESQPPVATSGATYSISKSDPKRMDRDVDMLQRCYTSWDAGTHITRQRWGEICRRQAKDAR